jgi:hypothetical protein
MAPKTDPTKPSQKQWPFIIKEAAKTPAGFFALALLVIEVILCILAALASGTDRTILIVGMVAALFAVIGIAAVFAYKNPGIWSPGSTPAPSVSATPEIERVKNPSILCVATPDFDPKWFEQGAAIVERTMHKKIRLHKRLTIERAPDFAAWRKLMIQDTFDIIHIAAHVDPKDGSLDFGNGQHISASGFRELVVECKARLVVLATCDSISLGAVVSRATNMIASLTLVKYDDFLGWAEVFYKKLSQGAPLSRAYDVASAAAGDRMVLLLRKDVVFQ